MTKSEREELREMWSKHYPECPDGADSCSFQTEAKNGLALLADLAAAKRAHANDMEQAINALYLGESGEDEARAIRERLRARMVLLRKDAT